MGGRRWFRLEELGDPKGRDWSCGGFSAFSGVTVRFRMGRGDFLSGVDFPFGCMMSVCWSCVRVLCSEVGCGWYVFGSFGSSVRGIVSCSFPGTGVGCGMGW